MDEKSWSKILAEVKPISISIAALLGSTKLLKFEGDKLDLGVYYKFHKDKLEENKNKQILEEAFRKVFDRQIKIECILTDAPPKTELTDIENKNIMTAAEEIFS